MSAIRKNRADRIFDGGNIAVMIAVLLVTIYPLYFTVIASVSDPYAVVAGQVFWKWEGFTTEAYRNVFKESRIWLGYRNTAYYTAFGTLWNLVLTVPAAYVLGKRKLVGRAAFSVYFLIPMYFGGGLIPTYLQVKSLGLINTPYTLIVLGGLSIYNMIVTRVYFQTSVPEELYESVYIDGASELTAFVRIALPLAKPILAVMVLFYAVGRWNEYFTALIYLSNQEYQPLQIVLRGILLQSQAALADVSVESMDVEQVKELARVAYMAQAMKYALIFVASAPLLAAYPFVQKYFVKGVMIGSIKG